MSRGTAGLEPATHKPLRSNAYLRHRLIFSLQPNNFVLPEGFEPTTPGLKDRYSVQLSYESILGD